METIHIRQFKARYLLASSLFSEKERLDRIVHGVLNSGLETALNERLVSPGEEICIRKIHFPMKLRTTSTDHDLMMQLSVAFTDAIHQAVTGGSHNIIRYTSRVGALVDFAVGITQADFSRVWAWRQLGFVPSGQILSIDAAACSLVKAMLSNPQHILPVIGTLARSRVLGQLAKRMQPNHWEALAEAVLSFHGADPHEVFRHTTFPGLKTENSGESETVTKRWWQVARRIMHRSAIGLELIRMPRVFAGDVIPVTALSAFTALDGEPGLFNGDPKTGAALVRAVAAVIEKVMGGGEPQILPGRTGLGRQTRISSNRDRADSTNTGTGLHEEENETLRSSGTKPLSGPAGYPEQQMPPPPDALSSYMELRQRKTPEMDLMLIHTHNGAHGRKAERSPSNSQAAWQENIGQTPGEESLPVAAEEHALESLRKIGTTRFGGLLFLINVLSRLYIITEINQSLFSEQRPMGWSLHQLALAVTGEAADDPAVLAFCGIRPGDLLPWQDEPPPNETEKTIIMGWRERIVEELKYRLKWESMSGSKIIHRICWRTARIIADPGWFDIIFSLTDVSVDLRRGALDLDPGYVPWLGVVMKFTYE